MTSVRRALAISFAERYALIMLSLAGSMLIARLLTPEEIGIYSVSLAVIGIAQVLRDFGIGSFLIQEKNLTDDHVRTAFGFSLLIGGTLFAAAFFAAPFAARFYDEARMIETLRISSLNFLILPFCSISLSLLRRDMAFKRIAAVNISAATLGFVVIIGSAFQGYGPNSMALGAVAGNIVTGIGAWIARTDRKLLLPNFVYWRSLLGFGSRVSSASIITSVAMDINDLAIGKILGFTPVAIISRAQGLMNIFQRDIMSAIRNVAYPSFAKASREKLDIEAAHIYSVTIITSIAWPFYLFTALHSKEILRVLFGPQWDAAAPLVPWFCLAGAAISTCNLILPMLMAQGRVDLAASADLIIQPTKAIVLITGALIYKDILVFAILFATINIIVIPFFYYIKSKHQATDISSTLSGVLSSAKITLYSSIGPVFLLGLQNMTNSKHGTMIMFASAIAHITGWVISIQKTQHPISKEPFFQKITFAFSR